MSRPSPGCRLRISAGTRVATATGHQPGAGDTCNWGSAVMAQSRPAEHPLMVRRKTYPIKSLRNVLLWNSFWLDGRCHDIEMQWWFISLFSKNTISRCRNSAEWQWNGVWSGSEPVIYQASSDTGHLYHPPTINCPLCHLLSANITCSCDPEAEILGRQELEVQKQPVWSIVNSGPLNSVK